VSKANFNRVLVPVDFSSASKRALDHALTLVAEGGQVDVIHVAAPPSTYLPLDRMVFDSGEEVQRDWDREVVEGARQELEAFLQSVPAHDRARISERLVTGVPYEAILEVAKDGGHDLLVMSTHGRSGAKRVLMGSVAERLLRRAPCPVLTVRG
jgi:nucleotide-binding universal stress UspA family protein